MNQLIEVKKQIIGNTEINAVDARGLHEFLEVETRLDTWLIRRIEEYGFVDGIDFCSILSKTPNGGRPRTDYIISLDMAKELSMVERNEKGKQARQYFIECENRLRNSTPQLPDFSNPAEAARAWAAEFEAKQIAQQLIIEQAPKVEFARSIEGSEGRLSIGAFAKLGGNIGRNTLFKILREKKILMQSNTPYQEFIDRWYFETGESVIKRTNGDQIFLTTYVTGKGQTWIHKNISEWSKSKPA